MSDHDYLWYFVGLIVSSPMNVLGFFMLAVLAFVLTQAQLRRGNKIDLSYLLVDTQVGQVTLAKFGGLGAFAASTWVFVLLPVTGHFDTGYASVYLLTWSGVKVAQDYFNSKVTNTTPDGIVSTTATVETKTVSLPTPPAVTLPPKPQPLGRE